MIMIIYNKHIMVHLVSGYWPYYQLFVCLLLLSMYLKQKGLVLKKWKKQWQKDLVKQTENVCIINKIID